MVEKESSVLRNATDYLDDKTPRSRLKSTVHMHDCGNSDTFEKFKVDIKRLPKEDRSFAEGIFRHRCPREQKDKVLTLDQCRNAIGECKRKIRIPPSAVSLLGELFDSIGEGRDTVDINEFLALLSRMLNDADATRRHNNRKAYGLGTFDGGVHGLKRVASNIGREVGSFLGVLDTGGTDPALEIFQERERRLTQRRTIERRREAASGGPPDRRQSMKYRAMKILPRLPGSNLFEADFDEDPEEQPLDYADEEQDVAESTMLFDGAPPLPSREGGTALRYIPETEEDQSLLSFRGLPDTPQAARGKKGAPPPLPYDDAPPLPGRDAGAPPLPGRDAGAPPLPGRDAGAPPLPGRDAGAPPLPGRDAGAPSLPGRDAGGPPLPGRDAGAPPLPGRDAGAPPLPGRDAGAPPLPGRDVPPVPGSGPDAPPLPSRGKVGFNRGSQNSTDDSAPPLPGRDGENSNAVPLPKRDYRSTQEYIESRDEALAYYRRRATKEKAGSVRKAKSAKEDAQMTEESWKNARSQSVKDRIKQKFLKKKVETMPVFSPWMIYLITYAQLIVLIILTYKGNFDTIAFVPKFVAYNISTLVTATGSEISSFYEPINFWIGPSKTVLIQNGAVFSPCMRKDHIIGARYRKVFAIDKLSRDGCCVKELRNVVRGIYTNERKCNDLYGPGSTFYPQTCLKLRNQRVVSNEHSACCYGLQGHCQLLTLPDCSKIGGTYHRNRTCEQVNCLGILCGFGGLEAKAPRMYEPTDPNQWWRFFTALFLHHGIIHVVIVAAAQIYIGRRIERSAGWLRLFLIYFVSGMMANVAAAYANPYAVTVGGSGGLAGLLSVLFIELFNMWAILSDPINELSSLCFYLALMFVIGTLPGLNNFAHLAGFIFGLLMAVLLLPYVSFGKWAIRRKRIIAGVSFTLLLILITTLLLFFSIVQSSEFCPKCDSFNCIDFLANYCSKFRPTQASSAALYSGQESAYYSDQN